MQDASVANVDLLDFVPLLPRLVRNLIPVAFLVGFVLCHGLTIRLFDDAVYYESNRIQADLRQDFRPIIANARRAQRRELRASELGAGQKLKLSAGVDAKGRSQ